jgi:hypothetical protein
MEMTNEEWDKWLRGTPKDRFDKEVGKLYHNCQSTECKAVIGMISALVNKLLENLKKEQDENTTPISN